MSFDDKGPPETIVLKLSGEGFAPRTPAEFEANDQKPISMARVDGYAQQIVAATLETNCRLAVVVGGGNIWRGASGTGRHMDDPDASDMIGMLATIQNGIALKDALLRNGACQDPRVMSAVDVPTACEPWIVGRARKHMDKGRIVICVGGIGEPNFTTDTAVVQRARNLRAKRVLKGTHGDITGIFSADPKEDPLAVFLPELTFERAIRDGLLVMDRTAFTHAELAGLTITVFGTDENDAIRQAIRGDRIGSLVHA